MYEYGIMTVSQITKKSTQQNNEMFRKLTTDGKVIIKKSFSCGYKMFTNLS